MKIKIIIFFIIIILLSVSIVKAEDEGWSYNYYSFGYSGWSEGNITLDIYVNLTYPSGRPNYYEPYPYWYPGYFETTEMCFLKTPYLEDNISGICQKDGLAFVLERNFPSEGNYKFFVRDNNAKLLFSGEFNMSYDLEIEITGILWQYNCTQYGDSYSNSVCEGKMDSISGVRLTFIIENTGDIPYFIGIPTSEGLCLDYKIRLIKDNDMVFTSENVSINRSDVEYYKNTWSQEAYIVPGEKFNCTEVIRFDDSVKLSDYGAGDYLISGDIYIDYENLSFTANCDDNLIIKAKSHNGGTPGFELISIVLAIAVILFCKRNKKI